MRSWKEVGFVLFVAMVVCSIFSGLLFAAVVHNGAEGIAALRGREEVIKRKRKGG